MIGVSKGQKQKIKISEQQEAIYNMEANMEKLYKNPWTEKADFIQLQNFIHEVMVEVFPDMSKHKHMLAKSSLYGNCDGARMNQKVINVDSND